jgi:phenol/toluene 2-monooxygenase (NADH) P0/A0
MRSTRTEEAMSKKAQAPGALPSHFDVTQKFVRVRHLTDDGYVEFDFSIGDPCLSVELVMSKHDFQTFCASNHARHLSLEEGERIDVDDLKWRYGRPGITE